MDRQQMAVSHFFSFFKCKALLLTLHSHSSGITAAHYCSLSVRSSSLCRSRPFFLNKEHKMTVFIQQKKVSNLAYQALSFQWHLGRFFCTLNAFPLAGQVAEVKIWVPSTLKENGKQVLNYSSNHKSRAQSSERCGVEWHQVFLVFCSLSFS